MSLTYYNPVYDGDIVYSCDMVRLKFHISKFNSQAFLDFIHHAEYRLDFMYDYFKSSKVGTYRHLFSCKYSRGNFTLGCDLQEPSFSEGMNCMIEFNPNKNDMDYMKSVLNEFAYFIKPIESKYYQLVRWDLAVDIPVERDNVILIKRGKREYHRIISTSLTEYVGRRNTNGFCKVYDKKEESNLDDVLTRIELTCDSLDTFSFPSVHILQEVERDDFTALNSTDIVLVNLIRRLDYDEQQQALKSLGRSKREKLREYIFPFEREFQFNVYKVQFVVSSILEFMTNFKGNLF